MSRPAWETQEPSATIIWVIPAAVPNTVNSFAVDVPANQTLVVVVEETNLAQTPGATYTVEVSGLVGDGVGPGPCGGGGELTLVSAASTQEAGQRRQVQY